MRRPPAKLKLAPGDDRHILLRLFPAALTPALRAPLTYFVELKNRNGRSAGLSNPATVLAGEAPPPVTGLAAEVRKEGIVLRWTPRPRCAIRLRRTLLTPPPQNRAQGLLPQPPSPSNKTCW